MSSSNMNVATQTTISVHHLRSISLILLIERAAGRATNRPIGPVRYGARNAPAGGAGTETATPARLPLCLPLAVKRANWVKKAGRAASPCLARLAF
jgi:hypothetical protein